MKYLFLFIALNIASFAQDLVLKAEYKSAGAGLLPAFNVVQNHTDNKIYTVAREKINNQWYLTVYDNGFKRLASVPSTAELNISNSFVINSRLYFSDNYLKYISLSDFKQGTVNSSRKDILIYSLEKLNGKNVILTSDYSNLFLYDASSYNELLNIKLKASTQVKATIYNNDIYFKSKATEISKFDVKNNRVSWSVQFPDKPIRFIGIKVTSSPNIINCINPFKKNNKEYIGIITSFGDYFTVDAATGKLVKDDVQYDKFENMSQNNSQMFLNSYLFDDRQTNQLLIYAASIDKSVYCLNEKDFSTVWETSTGNEIYMPLSLLDINNDGYPEIFGVNDYDQNLFVLDGKTGKKLIFKSLKEGKQFNRTNVHLVDFYGAGELNLVVKTNNEKIKVFAMPSIRVPYNFISAHKNIY
jgi:hypothetical protein